MRLNNILLFLSFILLNISISQAVKCVDYNNPNYYKFINPLYNNRAYCYIKAENASDISDAILYAQSINKGVSIRAGGHSATQFSVLNKTVNIDLSSLKGIEIDVEAQTAVVQAGVQVIELYNATTKYLLATTAGSCPTVGMGVVLGGGSNYFGGKYGYMADNVLEFTVVLEDGSIVKANPKNKYSDLYWALAGSGGGGFGVVVDYKLKLYPIPQYFYKNTIRFDIVNLDKALALLDTYVRSSTEDTREKIYANMYSQLTLKSTNMTPSASITFFYNGPLEEGDVEFRKLLTGFLSCPTTNATCTPLGRVTSMDIQTLKKTFWEVISSMSYDNNPLRQFTKGRFIKKLSKNDVPKSINDIYKYAVTNIINSTSLLKPETLLNINQAIFYHGGKQNQERTGSEDSPLNSFAHRGDEAMWSYTIVAQYNNTENDPLFSGLRKIVNSKLSSFGDKLNNNYPDDEVEDWQTGLYVTKSNYKKLQEIKLKYDSSNYFKFPQSIELPKNKNN
ncbi:hypothetical protein RB653_005935 [Dictyostelium firmibasis]|uniref:FAD-binding PCMH-type domain-containing protein n=1 Tax=Dictyostelium firmibasis TaxID=79012 RepID=A0AAN7YYM1_9MYCE